MPTRVYSTQLAEDEEHRPTREKDEPSISAPKPVNATTEFVDDMDFASDIPTDGPATVEMVNATKNNFDEDDLVKFQELLLDVEKPLYKGCFDFRKLSAIVKLLNLKGYKKIHVCINNCLLYWKDDKDLTACRTCGISRWKVDRVDTYDDSTKDNFNLHAVVLWTINDYAALGTLCACPYNGFKGCVVCGKDTYCVRLSASSKQSYDGHRRYLQYNHPFIKQKKAFNGQQEFLRL
ncbi:putative ribonuclease H-like domain-containing protein [Tanacetum coccineum]